MQKNNQGFTLAEVLTVVAVTGIIAAMAAFLLNNSQRTKRDMARIADITKIKNALELHFYNCNKYPATLQVGKPIGGESCGGNIYLKSVPADVSTNLPYQYTSCTGNGPYQCSLGQEDATSYEIEYTLEGDAGGLKKGRHKATPEGY